jgi:Rad3-related DNA helicase
VRSALLKGRGHYLSLRRLDRWLAAPHGQGDERGDLDRLRFQLRCLVWAAETPSGDRTQLRLGGPETALWDEVNSTVDDCLGPSCDNWQSRRCFMVRARAGARDAEILVVSHALLLADLDSGGAILPPYHHLIVDEAHRLEESATAGASVQLRAADVLRIVDRLPAGVRGGGEGAGTDLAVRLDAARSLAVRAFGACKGMLTAAGAGSEGGRGRTLALTHQVRRGPLWPATARALARMAEAAAAAAAALRAAEPLQFAGPGLWPQPANVGPELQLAADALDAVAAAARRVLAAAVDADTGEVAWLELLGGEQAGLRLAPVTVGARLRAQVFDRCDAVVLTSATLTVGGSFAYVRDRLQLPAAEELVLPSTFDYLRQAVLCLPRPMPAPEHPRHTEVLSQLVADVATRLGGRTLVLFTAFAALRAAHAALRPRLEAEGLVASDANRSSTVAPLDVLSLEENLRILAVLEALAGRLAVERITPQDLDEIEALDAEVCAAAGDEARRTTANRAFHFRIYACAASPTLLSIMRILWASFPGGPQYGRPHAESVAQHARLVRALRRGDAAAVTRVIDAHTSGSAGYVRGRGRAVARDWPERAGGGTPTGGPVVG